jgi:hypothetical protein
VGCVWSSDESHFQWCELQSEAETFKEAADARSVGPTVPGPTQSRIALGLVMTDEKPWFAPLCPGRSGLTHIIRPPEIVVRFSSCAFTYERVL